MNFMQPTLENENVTIQPLRNADFERLYEVASDPKIWVMHPNKTVFKEKFSKIFLKVR